VGLSQGSMGGAEGKRVLESEKCWNTAPVPEDDSTQGSVSCWVTVQQGDRDKVSNGALIWLKHSIYMSEIPRWNYEYTVKKMKDKKVKQVLPGGGCQWEAA
jgi:hypothetical protein